VELSRRRFLAAAASAAAAPGPRPAERKLNIGVVGGRFGLQFQWHLHPGSQVAAVCDLRPDRQHNLQETYRCPNAYASYREMLRHPGLQAVAVFTPAPLHAWMAIEAMLAGKHVVSAVPAAITLQDLSSLIETVKQTGMRYAMAETTYYRPQIITCRDWAAQGRFGQIFHSESEYHHNIGALMWDERGLPTWRHGFPPMYYITHQTGAIVPVTGERLAEVSCNGWGDGHEVLRTNRYNNPFWNETAFFRTSGGHSSRVSVWWRAPAGFAQRTQFHGSKLSYIMGRRPENHPDVAIRWADGEPSEEAVAEALEEPQQKYWDRLPRELRVPTGHEGSHVHITHDFVQAVLEDRHPEVNAWEAAAYTAPGLVAHESALRAGETKKIPDFGRAPA
jgi:predicted dehydrogenase